MDTFYAAFSPICFVLLGLWLVVVQLRATDWQRDPELSRRLYGVALLFGVPGVLGLLSLIYPNTTMPWQFLFVVLAVAGAAAQVLLRGTAATGSQRPAAYDLGAVALYLVAAVLAIVDTGDTLRFIAFLLTLLVVLAVNIGWLAFMPVTLPSRPAAAGRKAESGDQQPTA